jgi:hypothetical protein
MAQQREEPRRFKKPVDFDQLYPGRFLKAGELLGQKFTVTISDVDLEELQGDDGTKKAKAILSFRETEKKLVTCKTNGVCLREMFGRKVAEWVGKRVTLFPDTWNGEPCIRVWGSPDIDRDFDVEITLPRRRPFKKTMHKTEPKRANGNGRAAQAAPEPEPASEPDDGFAADFDPGAS